MQVWKENVQHQNYRCKTYTLFQGRVYNDAGRQDNVGFEEQRTPPPRFFAFRKFKYLSSYEPCSTSFTLHCYLENLITKFFVPLKHLAIIKSRI